MPPKIDPAILKALVLEASNTTLAAHGGSGFAFTGKLTSVVDGKEKLFFVKTGKGDESEVMFTGTISSFLSPSFPSLSKSLFQVRHQDERGSHWHVMSTDSDN